MDKFGNLEDPVFSPRLAATFKPAADHAVRVSFNRAFRSPSVTNNYLDTSIVVPTDLSGLAPLLPPPLSRWCRRRFRLTVRAVGSHLPVGTIEQDELVEESLTAYEIAYNGTVGRTSFSAAFYVNDMDDQINFSQLPSESGSLYGGQSAAGMAASAGSPDGDGGSRDLSAAHGLHLLEPRARSARRGSSCPSITRSVIQWVPSPTTRGRATRTVLDDPEPYPTQELALPPTHRFNIGFSFDNASFLGSGSVNYSAERVLERCAHEPVPRFHGGIRDGQRQLRRQVGAGESHDPGARDEPVQPDIQQHVFGDIIKASVVGEVKFRLP